MKRNAPTAWSAAMPVSIFTVLLTCIVYPAFSQSEQEPFPRILTLPQALGMLSDDHPGLLLTHAREQDAVAERLEIQAETAFSATAGLDLRRAIRAVDPDDELIDDSRALLILDKPLTTFGRGRTRTAAVESDLKSLEYARTLDRASVRLEVMRAFYSVIVADYAYAAADEEMTLAFLSFDDAREQMELYQELPEVEVKALEAVYLDAFARRTSVAHKQRSSRLQLALALNRPNAYPDQVMEPDLSEYDRQLPDFDEMLEQVLNNNPSIQSARLQLEAQRQRLDGLTLARRPTLGTRFQAAEYERKLGSSRDQFRASLYLDIPLTRPRQMQGEIARQSAVELEHEARLKLLENELRLKTLNLVQHLERLETDLTAARADLLHRELDLDRVRLQYEMEIRARIGTANYEVARALHKLANARYQKALVWEQLDLLAGKTEVYIK